MLFFSRLEGHFKGLAEAETTGGQLVSVGKVLVRSSCVQLSLTAVSYAIWVLCEVSDKQSALIRGVNKAENVVLWLYTVDRTKVCVFYWNR